MDKITKVFVIAASSVIIAAGVLWIAGYVSSKARLEECVNTAIKMGYGGLKESTATEADRQQIRNNCLDGVYDWWRG